MNLTKRCYLKLVSSLITGKQFEIIALPSECSPAAWGWTDTQNNISCAGGVFPSRVGMDCIVYFMKIVICAPERQIRPNFWLVWTATLFVMENRTLNPFVL